MGWCGMEWCLEPSQFRQKRNCMGRPKSKTWFVLFNQADNFALSSCNAVGFWQVLKSIEYLWVSKDLFYHDIYTVKGCTVWSWPGYVVKMKSTRVLKISQVFWRPNVIHQYWEGECDFNVSFFGLWLFG